MKKQLLIITILATLFSFTSKDSYVFICMSKNSKRYHLNKNCSGLKRCKVTVKKITLIKAKKIGRTFCLIEKKAKQ